MDIDYNLQSSQQPTVLMETEVTRTPCWQVKEHALLT